MYYSSVFWPWVELPPSQDNATNSARGLNFCVMRWADKEMGRTLFTLGMKERLLQVKFSKTRSYRKAVDRLMTRISFHLEAQKAEQDVY